MTVDELFSDATFTGTHIQYYDRKLFRLSNHRWIVTTQPYRKKTRMIYDGFDLKDALSTLFKPPF